MTKHLNDPMNKYPIAKWLTICGLWFLLLGLPEFIGSPSDPLNWLKRGCFLAVIVLIVRLIELKNYLPFIILTVIMGGIFKNDRAWLAMIGWFSLTLWLVRWLNPKTDSSILNWLWIIFSWLGLAGLSGLGIALYNAMALQFAEEEFFSLILGLYLSFFWLGLAIIYHLTFNPLPSTPDPRPPTPKSLFLLSSFISLILLLGLTPWLSAQYQRSFFPATAPTYQNISEASPFLCATIEKSGQAITGNQVKSDLIALLEAAPDKSVLTLGSLAFYTGNKNYADAFREMLLSEAQQNLFTGPSNSVKWGQFEAALRAHQIDLLMQTFPALFSDEDKLTLKNWFTKINQRALTPEWVDYLYATAFNQRPTGPYLNQEIGAGLLAVLENTGLADPNLTAQNQAYLATTPLGWRELFRNTDDSYFYQGIWLSNAWWLYNHQQKIGNLDANTERHKQLSFRWLAALALPDGEPLSYNIIGSPVSTDYFLMGANLLHDPTLTWLTQQTLTRLLKQKKYLLSTFPLSNDPLIDGTPPDIGSCLIFGNSGVPTTKGPLAPDKVVLRDGWANDSLYALLNLRFSGWHRYKATNTLTLLYQQGPLVSEKWTAENFGWLPVGRSAFRDKRVPRENLNGLLLPNSGLSNVSWILSGVGSRWAQNPPAYGEVKQFFTSSSVDVSQTVLPNWNGWQHARTLYLIHPNLVLVVDKADKTDIKNSTRPASIIWHLNGDGQPTADGLSLNTSQRQARLVWSANAGDSITLQPEPPTDIFLRSPNWELLYTSPSSTQLNLASVFLTGERVTGKTQLNFIEHNLGLYTTWQKDKEQVKLIHNSSRNYLENGNLGTDGMMVLLIENQLDQDSDLCYIGGQTIKATLIHLPNKILLKSGESLPSNFIWQIEGNQLTIHSTENLKEDCLTLIY